MNPLTSNKNPHYDLLSGSVESVGNITCPLLVGSGEDMTYPQYKVSEPFATSGLFPLYDAPTKKMPEVVFAVLIQTEKDGVWMKVGDSFGIWFFKSLRNAESMCAELRERDRREGGPTGHVVNPTQH